MLKNNIEKFNRNNFAAWKTQVAAKLIGERVWIAITKPNPYKYEAWAR